MSVKYGFDISLKSKGLGRNFLCHFIGIYGQARKGHLAVGCGGEKKAPSEILHKKSPYGQSKEALHGVVSMTIFRVHIAILMMFAVIFRVRSVERGGMGGEEDQCKGLFKEY